MITLLRSRFSTALKWTRVFLAYGVGLQAAESVYAVPHYSGSININGAFETVSGSPNPVVLNGYTSIVDANPPENVIGQKTTASDAVASYGRLRGSSFADYLNVSESFPIFSGSSIGSQEGSSFALDDLVLTGPPGNIVVSFNFILTGGAIAIGGSSALYGSAQAEATMGYGSSFSAAGNIDIGKIGWDSRGFGYRYGIFSTVPVNSNGMATGTTPDIQTYAGDTALSFSLGLTMSTGVLAGYGAPQGYAYGSSSFTLGFPTLGPVANLPEGYTLNSTDGSIVDNRLVVLPGDFDFDGDVDGRDFLTWQRNPSVGSLADWQANYGTGSLVAANVAVPEPATLMLLALAAMGTGCTSRWRITQ